MIERRFRIPKIRGNCGCHNTPFVISRYALSFEGHVIQIFIGNSIVVRERFDWDQKSGESLDDN